MTTGPSAGARCLDDGLGLRRVESDPRVGTVEVLEVPDGLASAPGFEAALRTRVARCADAPIDGLAPVHRIERRGSSLRVVADHIDGLRLSDLLRESIRSAAPLTQPAAIDLAGQIGQIVARLHQVAGMTHGTINPAHVVVTPTGRVFLTDAVFGPAIAELQRNRDQLWREFGIVMPPSANLPRFDRRADVAQLGATVLAIALGRMLRQHEYPRPLNDLVLAATLAARPGETGTPASALRLWLQDALCLHTRATFESAVDAARSYGDVLQPMAVRRGGREAFLTTVRRVFRDGPESPDQGRLATASSVRAAARPAASAIAPAERAVDHTLPDGTLPGRSLSAMFRSVLPSVRAS